MVLECRLLMVLTLSFMCTGCIETLAGRLIVESRPSFHEVRTQKSLPPLPEDHGRLFVFKGGKMAFFGLDLCLNDKRYTLEDGTWFFADLSPGTYSLTKKDRSENELNFEIKTGEEVMVGVGEVPYLRLIDLTYAIQHFDSYNYTLPDVVSYDSHPFVKKYYVRACR